MVTDDQAACVRRATVDDAVAIAQLNAYVQRLHIKAAPEQFAPVDLVASRKFFTDELMDGCAVVWVAEVGGRPVGYLYAVEIHRPANPFTAEQHTLYIHHLAVDPTARRRGVGSALFQAAEQHARTQQLNGLRLDSWLFNETAHAFFRSQGFQPFLARFARDL
jgi:GNAT superfamily N-acetyltransferase